MKSLKRKSIIFMVILAMVVQMASTVFAGIYEWIDEGPHVAIVTATGNFTTKKYRLIDNDVFHSAGDNSVFEIADGKKVECDVNTNFPTTYKTYLDKALENEGYEPAFAYENTNEDAVTIPIGTKEGFYAIYVVFEGRGGDWSVRGTSNPEGAPATLCLDSYVFAPIEEYEIIYEWQW